MKIKFYVIGILSVIAGIFLDQYTKFLAVNYLKDAPIFIIEDVFELRYLENRGAAFGILQNQQLFFVIMGVILLFIGVVLYTRLPFAKRVLPLRICLILIISGAIGNMIDRITLNYVVDFLYFKLIDFPIFNVADIYVTVATVVVVFLILFYYKDDELDAFFKQLSFKHKKAQEK